MIRRFRTAAAFILTIAAGAAAATAPASASLYSDIQGNPFQKAIEKLSVIGVVSGFPDGTYKPDQPMTRLTTVAALAKGLDVKGSGTIPTYKDISEIPEDVRPAIAALLNTGAATQQQAEVKKDDIVYRLATDKAVYGIDDPVDLTFTITNTGKDDVKFEFPTTQYYDFIVKQGNKEIARESFGKTFVQGGPPLFLAPGRTISFPGRWRQLDQDSNPVPPGAYQIVAVFPLKDPVSVTLEFQKGLLTSFPDNTFRPNAQVTRAEFAALIVRAMGRQGEATQKASAPLAIKDAADVPGPLHGYVAAAIDQKVMAVGADGMFRPNAPTTRAEAAGALAVVMDSLNRFNYVKGTLVSISASDITVSNASKAVTSYALVPNAAVYKNDKSGAPGDLKPNDNVLVLLTGVRGRAGYIEATGP